jgi:hypothetical protein
MSGHVRSSFYLLGFGEDYYVGADAGKGFLVRYAGAWMTCGGVE